MPLHEPTDDELRAAWRRCQPLLSTVRSFEHAIAQPLLKTVIHANALAHQHQAERPIKTIPSTTSEWSPPHRPDLFPDVKKKVSPPRITEPHRKCLAGGDRSFFED